MEENTYMIRIEEEIRDKAEIDHERKEWEIQENGRLERNGKIRGVMDENTT